MVEINPKTAVDESQRSLDSISAELQATQQLLETTERELRGFAAQLEAILHSRAWRWVTRYDRIKNWLPGHVRSPKPVRPSQSAENNRLRFGLDARVPDTIIVGQGNALYIVGWCYHPENRIKNLALIVDGMTHPMKAFGMPRQDIFDGQFPDYDLSGNSYRSGFWAMLTFPEIERPTVVEINLQATLSDGKICHERIEELTLQPAIEPFERLSLSRPCNSAAEPLVAVCMATYNPPLDLFANQIQSIVAQTYSNWICVISDDNSRPDILENIRTIIARDQRFHLFPASSRLGFYHNFERSISLAPDEADFITLSDQDDHWHADKLEMLLSQFAEDTTLVYSDMNIVDQEGKQLANTYWTTRPNNYKNFASLLMANTITGAASMFSKKLLKYILPFPQKIGDPYHDHWIGCAALALGEVKYVDRPLYDYVQHGANALGHYAPQRKRFWRKVKGALKYVLHFRNWLHACLANGQMVYFYDLMREQLMCRVLDLRCGRQLSASKRKTLWRITHVDETFSDFLWLATRRLRRGRAARETVGAEKVFLAGAFWKISTDLRLWFRDRVFGNKKPITALAPTQISRQAAAPAGELTATAQRFSQVQFTQQKIAPLSLEISPGAPSRINLLVPKVDLRHFFGGYITKLNLARRLAEANLKVRIVIVDICDYLPTVWRRQLQSYDGLEKLFDNVETVYAYDRSKFLQVSEQDVFIATTWWTAHIAHRATQAIRKEKFLYLIQEYEPFTFPMGTFASLANQTYAFPHYAIFSTELLREYFRENRIGLFAAGNGAGENDSISFQNCISSVGEVRPEDLANRAPKKLLFYARPEDHAARNMFEIAVLSLAEAIRSGYFTGDWEFYGIGTVGGSARLELSNGVHMTLLPRQSQEAYRQVLRGHDLGLSLMYTPHPSLVPIEMAAAGMLVVTNTFANKTGEKLKAISANIIAAEPTIEGIAQGLKTAVSGVEDYGRRAQGSRVNWPTRWEDSFDEKFLSRIKQFIGAVSQ